MPIRPVSKPADERTSATRPAAARSGPVIDAGVVRRLQAGDRAAFRIAYDRLVGMMYATCLRILGDRTLAEDAVQCAFIRIWQSASSLRSPEAFVVWARRIGANVALQTLRRMPEVDSLDESANADPAVNDGSARMDLEAALALLPPRRRAVLVLHDIEGYKHYEIGEMLGIAEGTSKAHLSQAREQLKRLLGR